MKQLESRKVRAKLITRWHGEDARISAIISDLILGQDWTVNLLENAAFGWKTLDGLETCSMNKLPSEATCRDLRGILLKDIDLTGRLGNYTNN